MHPFWPIAGIAALTALTAAVIAENTAVLRLRQDTIRCPAYQGAPLRLLLLSDLHCTRGGRKNHMAEAKVREAAPDYILIAGDLVSRSCRDIRPAVQTLRILSGIAPVFYCPGNHELDLSPDIRESLYAAAAQCGVTLLDNATVPLNPHLLLAGASLRRDLYRDEHNGFRHLRPYTTADLEQAIGAHKGCTLLLAHNPLGLDAYAAWGADLVLAGHVHGGIVRLPVIGGLLSPERRFFPPYSRGLYRKDGTQMLVCGGIGKLRFANPPEMRCITLTGC